MSRSVSITVRWVASVDQVPDALWRSCFAPPLEGRWWYEVLENCGVEKQFQFSYGILERAAEPIGVAPVFLMDVPLDIIAPDRWARVVRTLGKFAPFLRYRRTLFVGSPCADEGTVGLAPGERLASLLPSLAAAVETRAEEQGAAQVVWKDFTDADAPAFTALLDARRYFRVISFPGTRLTLPAGGFAGYLQSLKGSHRHNLKKKLRRGDERLPTDASVVQRPDAKTLDDIFALFWQTYLKGKTKFETLDRRFFEWIAAVPTSYFVLLRSAADGRLLAFMLCFDCGQRVINKFIGIDYSIEDAYLYFRLWRAAVDWATSKNFTEFQSGQTGYRAKLDLGHSLVPLTNFARCRNPLVQRFFAWQARGIDWTTIDPDLKTFVNSPRGKTTAP